MRSGEQRVTLAGSAPPVDGDALQLGPVAPWETLEVTAIVRRRHPLPAPAPLLPPIGRRALTRVYGASPHDVGQVCTFARTRGLDVVEVNARAVRLRGTAMAIGGAFGVALHHHQSPRGRFRAPDRNVRLPARLAESVDAIIGLDDRPVFRPRAIAAVSDSAIGARDLAAWYGFPAALDGAGQRMGIVELGGGFSLDDLRAYSDDLGLPSPNLSVVPAPHGRNRPGVDARADREIALDLQLVSALAPRASLTIFFADDATEQGLVDALRVAIEDPMHRPTILLLPWGASESDLSVAFILQVAELLREAAHLGITVCAATGDDGSADAPTDRSDGRAHADFPATCPWVLGCGGTRTTRAGASLREEVWRGTGGGVSAHFTRPAYQRDANVPRRGRPMRGVPDVAANADPTTGYRIRLDGAWRTVGGTSASAALWAGLVAKINQALGRNVGFLNPLVYGSSRAAFRDIVVGGDGAWPARSGWDACTGLGTPRGAALIGALRAAAPA